MNPTRKTIVPIGALAVLALVGCGGGGGSPTEPTGGLGPFGQIAGRWSGTVTTDIPPVIAYPAMMNLNGTANLGAHAGTTDYPSFNCGGSLVGQQATGPNYVMSERLEYGRAACPDGGTVRLTYDPATRTMLWRWHFADGTLRASGTLTRE